jgi:sortase A
VSTTTQDQRTAELPVVTSSAPTVPPPDDVTWAGSALPPEVRPPVSLRRTLLVGLLVAGTLLTTFAGYELWFSGLLQSRSQAALLSEFRRSLALDDTPQLVTPPIGRPVGVVEIPRLGGEQVIVQGIGSDQTKMGPGHDPSSPAPGQAGNAVLVGRRTTYGAPFRRLDALRTGDSIIVTTRQGQFLYSVLSSRTASLGDTKVVAASSDARMTLITSDPAYHPGHELVVVAKMQGEGLQAPGPLPLRSLGDRPGRSTNLDGWGSILLWGQLLAAAIAGTLYLYRRRWNPAVTYLLTTPVLITLAVLFYRAVDGLLPPTL